MRENSSGTRLPDRQNHATKREVCLHSFIQLILLQGRCDQAQITRGHRFNCNGPNQYLCKTGQRTSCSPDETHDRLRRVIR
jgi:hypothetical protein